MSSPDGPFALHPIGVVRSGTDDVAATAIQGRLDPASRGTVVVDPSLVDGLEGLDQFDYAWLVTVLHQGADDGDAAERLRPTPFLARPGQPPVGVFATRFPRRPNPIGLSLIRIVSVVGNAISFLGVDVVDGTPVIDLKPWVPSFDLPHDASAFAEVRTGWYLQSRLEDPLADAPTGWTPNDLGDRP